MPDIKMLAARDARNDLPAKKVLAMPERQWRVRASPSVTRSKNPIRETLASITANAPSTSKAVINLGLGDPTHYPLHAPPAAAMAAVNHALHSGRANGYVNGVGSAEARAAVVAYHERWDKVSYDISDIVLTHGVGQALDLVFSVMIPPASVEKANILLPRPGFAQYSALLANLDAEIRYYDCIEEQNWEVDLDMLNNLCDEDTRAILLTNPSNPVGSNYSREALEAILAIAEKHKVPIIADEIYGHMTWDGPFVPMASLSQSVPIITLSGLSKRFLFPGWRFGWVAVHDPLGVAIELKRGMAVWGNRFMGPNSLIQAALPTILATEAEWFNEVTDKIKTLAGIVYEGINDTPGLSCTAPQGAMYAFVKIASGAFPAFNNDVAFSTALYREEAIFVLPGMCFGAPGYIRVVLATPSDIMGEVMARIQAFSQRHFKE
ncbi:tyrosine aminotransferase [Kwoniella heveanensis CBS 569]|uniref:Tyrosine aminotransferase n=1 Tax=Kwoniella heveanensis BCC8398 TaxID=1296120 RepID=A0A1B9GK56_9TREE|nr:tyrosine aminotransferase [Kwoniella heveanensis BCC8398]OCF44922.1 tyrosine aminotransferase [Kwoniella heveanensis CBS 569]